uniref:Uncharacterized protein n=1 Tax=Arundo donax TaxID=35708 RepID=A0A0A8YD46_ARUDO
MFHDQIHLISPIVSWFLLQLVMFYQVFLSSIMWMLASIVRERTLLTIQ